MTAAKPVELERCADEASAAIIALRRWAAPLYDRDPVRDAIIWTARAAAVRRMVGVGVGSELEHYEARDILQVALCVVSPEVTRSLARIAFTLALIEDDQEVVDGILASGVLPDCAAWLALVGQAHLAEAEALVEPAPDAQAQQRDPMQLAVTRLLLARRLPVVLRPAWWSATVAVSTTATAHLILVAIEQRPDLLAAASAFLAAHHAVLAAIDGDRLLAALVHRSAGRPSSTLLPFEGWYGDPTMLAAAAWHLEHGQPAEAITVAARIRPLSDQHDGALLVTGLALIGLQRIAEAVALVPRFDADDPADELRLRLAVVPAGGISDDQIFAIAERSTPYQGERFFLAVRTLLGRRRIDLARTIARRRQAEFQHVPAVRDALVAILGKPGAA